MTAATPLVYIVDDDASVRRSLTRLIAAAGYRVQAFGSAHEYLGREREVMLRLARRRDSDLEEARELALTSLPTPFGDVGADRCRCASHLRCEPTVARTRKAAGRSVDLDGEPQ